MSVLAGRAGAGAIVLVVTAALAGCGSESTVSPPTASGGTVATSTIGSSSDSSASNGDGTLTLVYDVAGADSSLEDALVDVRERAAAMGVDADVSETDGAVQVIVRGVGVDDVSALERSFDSLGATVQIRPVLTGCLALSEPTATSGALYTSTTAAFELPHQDSDPSAAQFLPIAGVRPIQVCQVGPSLATGAVFEADAVVQEDPAAGLVVIVSLRPGAGTDAWNAAAAACYDRSATCPTQQLALELDGELQSVATVQTPAFEGTIQISGAFDAHRAAALADTLSRGGRDYSLELTRSDFAG